MRRRGFFLTGKQMGENRIFFSRAHFYRRGFWCQGAFLMREMFLYWIFKGQILGPHFIGKPREWNPEKQLMGGKWGEDNGREETPFGRIM
jgi:hypothetical protein